MLSSRLNLPVFSANSGYKEVFNSSRESFTHQFPSVEFFVMLAMS